MSSASNRDFTAVPVIEKPLPGQEPYLFQLLLYLHSSQVYGAPHRVFNTLYERVHVVQGQHLVPVRHPVLPLLGHVSVRLLWFVEILGNKNAFMSASHSCSPPSTPVVSACPDWDLSSSSFSFCCCCSSQFLVTVESFLVHIPSSSPRPGRSSTWLVGLLLSSLTLLWFRRVKWHPRVPSEKEETFLKTVLQNLSFHVVFWKGSISVLTTAFRHFPSFKFNNTRKVCLLSYKVDSRVILFSSQTLILE